MILRAHSDCRFRSSTTSTFFVLPKQSESISFGLRASAREISLLAAEIVLGKHLSSKATVFRRAKTISVRSRPGMWFNVDGELVGNAPALFQILPRALNFVVKR